MTFDFEGAFSQNRCKVIPHACLIFDDLDCYRKIAVEFICEGINQNEKCMMAVDTYPPQLIRSDFVKRGVPYDQLIASGQLSIVEVKESYSGAGDFDPDATIEIWKTETDRSVLEGFKALRVVGEATFSLGRPELEDKLIYYENRLNQAVFPEYPFKSICVYEKKLYPPNIIKRALQAYPILIYNEELFKENIHYIPPEIYFAENKDTDEIELWLQNVRRNNENLKGSKASEKKFRRMFEKAPLGYQSLDSQGNFIEVNNAWLSLLGYTRQEVIGRNFSEILHPDWKEHFRYNFPRFKAVGEVLGVEFEIAKKDGSFILVSFHGKIAKDKDNNFQQTHCIFQDITAQKESEIKLVDAQQHLVEAQAIAKIGSWKYDIKADGAEWSKEMYRIFDRDCELGMPSWGMHKDFIHPEDWERVDGAMNGAAHQGVPYKEEFRIICRDGSVKWAETIGKCLKDKFGQITGLSGTVQDIHQRKTIEAANAKLQERVEQAQKMETIGTLAGGIAHDFNNILFPILGHSELLAEDIPPEDQSAHESIRQIRTSALRAKDLVQQILTFSRQEKIEYKPLQIQLILKEVIKFLRATTPKNIEISQHVDPECGRVLADATQVHQVVMNLTTNACQAMEDRGGQLRIHLNEIEVFKQDETLAGIAAGVYVCLSVSDTGTGISSDIKEKIFEPYFTTKKKGKGTGIGLSVVHGIVRNMKGVIKLYSEKDIGTEFKVYLPLHEKKSADSPKGGVPENDLKGWENIMLVDDEESIARLEHQTLGKLGYTIKAYTNPIDALEYFRNHPGAFDLVLTDLSMPKMGGEQLAIELLKVQPGIPILLCTGFTDKLTLSRARQIGIKDVLLKPILINELASKIRKYLDEAQ